MASEQQINRLSGLLVVKMIRQQITLNNRLAHQSATLSNNPRQWQTVAEHCILKSGLPLMRGLDIYQNFPVSKMLFKMVNNNNIIWNRMNTLQCCQTTNNSGRYKLRETSQKQYLVKCYTWWNNTWWNNTWWTALEASWSELIRLNLYIMTLYAIGNTWICW